MPTLELSVELFERLTSLAAHEGISISDYLKNRVAAEPHKDALSFAAAELPHIEERAFPQSILNHLPTQVAVLNNLGEIIFVNKAWIDFALANGAKLDTIAEGVNYLEVCDQAVGEDSEEAASFAAGIRAIISGKNSSFTLEYPCHSRTEQRWFIGRVLEMPDSGAGEVLVVHENITARKLLEIEIRNEARNNEARYRAIIENFPNGMVALYNTDLVYTVAEGQGLAQVGMTSADLVGKRLRDVFPPEVYERDEPSLLAALAGEVTDALVGYAGQYFRVTTLPVKDDEGTIISGMVLTQNITELIQAQTRHKELSEQLELAVNSANLGVWSMDIKTSELTWNDRLYDIYSVTRDTFDPYYDNFMNHVHPEDRDYVTDVFEKLLAQGNIREERFRIIRPNGDIRYIETSGYAVYDDNYEVIKILGINRDVTELERSRQELRDSEERYRSLFNGFLHPVVVYDREARFVMVNDVSVKNLGLRREDIIGRPLGDFIPENQEMTVERIARVLANQEAIFVEDKIEIPTGDMWFWSVMQPVFSEKSKHSEVQVISYDITERKHVEALEIERANLARKLEQEQELAQLRNRLFSVISHEFRTPLTIISSSTQMINRYIDRLDPQELQNRISKISNQISHLVRLLEEVTLLAKFNSHFYELNPSSVNVAEFYRNIMSGVEDMITDTHTLRLELKVQGGHVVVDDKLLYHALMNIVSNAIKYSPDGGEILLQVIQTDSDWRFITKDNGIGIPVDEQSDLFKIFTRASNVEEIAGTGIGLSLVKEVAELHGGRVELESELGVGSTFTIIIPFPKDAKKH